MRNLFPVEPIPDYSAPTSPQPIAPIDNTGVNPQQPFDVASRMNELYTPETAASDRYNELVQSQPQYENPSFLRTIGAALSAFGPGGHKTGQEVMNWHNNLNQNEWKQNLAPAQHAADNERQANVNERTLAHTTVSNELRARADAEKAINNDKVNKVRADRAAVYEFKAKNPNMKFITPPGGNIIAVDPTNPSKVITLTDSDGNPISSGKLSETDKINLQHENTMEKQDDQQSATQSLEATKQDGRNDIAETRGWQLGSIPDPNDPTKQIGVRINQITGETIPIAGGVFTKAGTPGKAAGPAVDPKVRLQAVRTQTQETLNVINKLIDEKGNLTSKAKGAIGGSRAFMLHKVPGSDALTADSAINTLKSKLMVALIGEMKAQSRTGATGFGAMSIKELGILENAIGELNPESDEENFANELNTIRDKLKLIMQPGEGEGNQTVTPKGNVPLSLADRERLKAQYLPKR